MQDEAPSLVVEWTYNSNSNTIESNTLTMSEIKVVLEGITVGGKNMVEHLEATNYRDSIVFVVLPIRLFYLRYKILSGNH